MLEWADRRKYWQATPRGGAGTVRLVFLRGRNIISLILFRIRVRDDIKAS